MADFEVLNVGQGDSILLRPSSGCRYGGKTVFIDLGPGRYDITENIDRNDHVHIFLTHHDNDHLGGMHFFAGKMDQVEEIIVPLYQNEITLIARAILNLKGIREAEDCGEFVKALEEVVNNQAFLVKVTGRGNAVPQLTFAYEGRDFCKHIKCLNPPCCLENYDWLGEADRQNLTGLMQELFTGEFAEEMERYIHSAEHGYVGADSPEFRRFWLRDWQYEDMESYRAGCNYVLGFFAENVSLLRQLNATGSRKCMRKIYKNYVKCTHDICTVLWMKFGSEPSVLLAGDASKKVFERLIREGKAISADYLKMPHHGSRHNMNRKILRQINPETVIISHDNRRFGRAKDSHPNQEVLDLLQSEHVNILITNDVVKNGITVMQKQRHSQDDYIMIR